LLFVLFWAPLKELAINFHVSFSNFSAHDFLAAVAALLLRRFVVQISRFCELSKALNKEAVGFAKTNGII
jgi:hypothetical protein